MNVFAYDIRRFQSHKDVEIEVRLGRLNNGFFDTDIGEPLFKKLIQSLEKYSAWEKVEKTEDEVFYFGNGVRCIYNGKDSLYQKKTPLVKKDIKLTHLDVRLAISTEVKIPEVHDDANRSVTRKRTSFLRKNVRIDCTEVSGSSDDKDCEDSVRYQVELEFLNVGTDQLIFSAVNKVNDLLNCV